MKKLFSNFRKNISSETSEQKSLSNRVDSIFALHYHKSPKVVVITPTTGVPCLASAIKSVAEQNFGSMEHLVVIDGEKYKDKATIITNQLKLDRLKTVTLPASTGRNGFNGHRIYAVMPYLISSDYIFFLDQDNWVEANHVQSCIDLIEHEKLDWAYSLRKIYTQEGKFVANDNCESLGKYPAFSKQPNCVDTNCYAIKRKVLTQVAHYWYHPLGADRYFYKCLSEAFPNFRTTAQYTVNYRLTDSRPPTPEFFLKGNQFMLEK